MKEASGDSSVTTRGPDGLDTLQRALSACNVPPGTRYGLVLRDSRVLCALPADRETACRTLSLYQPQRQKAKWLAAGFRFAAKLGIHQRFLRMWHMPFDGTTHPAPSMEPVGVLVGSSGHLCERAVTVKRTPECWEVAKLAFGGDGAAILGREADMLEKLVDDDRVPRLLGFESGRDLARIRMAWQAGQSWSTDDLEPLLEMLAEWGGHGHDTRPLADFPEWRWIEPVLMESGPHEDWLQELAALRVRPSIRHGDLTRPNLRRGSDGRIRIHDWERASMEGIPGIDLVHFLVQDAFFRSRLNPSEVLRQVRERLLQPPVASWLAEIGWNGREDQLMLLSCALNTGARYIDQRPLLIPLLENTHPCTP